MNMVLCQNQLIKGNVNWIARTQNASKGGNKKALTDCSINRNHVLLITFPESAVQSILVDQWPYHKVGAHLHWSVTVLSYNTYST